MFNINSIPDLGLIYLASPYTKYPQGRHAAHSAISRITAVMLENDHMVFSPIAYSHPLENLMMLRDAAEEHAFWMTVDHAFMNKCDCIVVAMLDGWQDSAGVTEEIETFKKAGKPIWYLNPKNFHMSQETH